MTADLMAFLRARLDEDEAAARRVDSSWRQIGNTGVIVASDGERAEECANGKWTGIAEHIARHDPARVLREVEAKRQVLTGYTKSVEAVEELGVLCERLKVRGRDAFMTEMDLASAIHRRDTLHGVLCLLALPYDDHPDYREEWRP